MKKLRLLAVMVVLSTCTRGDEGWVDLLGSSDFSAWRQPIGDWRIVGGVAEDPQNPQRLVAKDGSGVIVNGNKGKTSDLVTRDEFGDIEAHIEFLLSAKSNSGVYFMGRYEVQIYDSYGVEQDKYPGIECGGIYPEWINNQNVRGHSPRVNVSRKPGEWQTFDVIFRSPRFDAAGKKTANAMFVKVVHNGKIVHENVEVFGPTRGGWGDEKAVGPLRFQGDHGPIAYRNLRVRELKK